MVDGLLNTEKTTSLNNIDKYKSYGLLGQINKHKNDKNKSSTNKKIGGLLDVDTK